MAHGSEPSPPASETWITISGDTAPAIGAWMMGCLTRRRSRSRASGHMGGVHRLGGNPLSYTRLNRAVEVPAAAADPEHGTVNGLAEERRHWCSVAVRKQPIRPIAPPAPVAWD